MSSRKAQKPPAASQRRRRLFEGYRPHKRQRALHESSDRFLVVCAGRRSGKTYALAREFVRRVFLDLAAAQEKIASGSLHAWSPPIKDHRKPYAALGSEVKPLLHYWVIAPTYELTAAPQREIFEILGGQTDSLILKWNKTLKQLWLAGGIMIEFKSADDHKRLVSVGLDGVWIDEAARVTKDTWLDAIEPTLANKQGWALFSTTPLGQNWFYSHIWLKTDLSNKPELREQGFKAFHFTTAHNTAVPNLAKEAKEAKKRLPKAIYLRNYEADFFAFEGKVYESFLDGEPHLFKPRDAPRFARRIAGVDWGYSNPGVIVEIGFDVDDTAWLYRETYQAGLLIAPISTQAQASWVDHFAAAAARGVEVFYCDPSEPEHIDAIRLALKQRGIKASILPAANAVSAGISAVSAFLEPVEVYVNGPLMPALMISEDCSNTRRELGTYQWQGDKEAPIKKDDHACDALRYALYSEYKIAKRKLPRLETLPSIFSHTA